jgi:hypothetical protein
MTQLKTIAEMSTKLLLIALIGLVLLIAGDLFFSSGCGKRRQEKLAVEENKDSIIHALYQARISDKEELIRHLQEDVEWYEEKLKANDKKAVVVKQQAHEKINRVDSFVDSDILRYLSDYENDSRSGPPAPQPDQK